MISRNYFTNRIDPSGVGRYVIALAVESGGEVIVADLQKKSAAAIRAGTDFIRTNLNDENIIDSIEDIPYVTDSGAAIRFLRRDGGSIHRYEVPAADCDYKKGFVFMDLNRIGHLFEKVGAPVNHRISSHKATTYPMFYSRLGNYQSHTAFPAMGRVLAGVGRDVGTANNIPVPEEYLMSYGDNCYTAVSHRIRSESKLLESGKGTQTRSAAGTYATTPKARRAADSAKAELENGLPFQKFNHMLETALTADKGSLRFETNIGFDIYKLSAENQNMSYVFDSIICPIARGMMSGPVFDRLVDSSVAIHPDIGRKIFQVSTFPVTSLLTKMHDRVLVAQEAGQRVPPVSVELVNVLERLLWYGHTGHAKVLCKSGMKALGILGHLKEGLLPTIHHRLYDDLNYIVPDSCWPRTEDGNLELPSAAAQLYTYGKQHLSVSTTRLVVRLHAST